MDVLKLIYNLLIGPLELFFEVVFAIAYRFLDNPGLSIVFLSLAMNFLVLPLYRRADAMQEAERDRAAAMRPWVDHIKKTFAGDERFMMLQAYYRQVGYRQTDSLRGSVSLLLEIPFFIAAYHFLSNLALLRGIPFGPIPDLGAPDGLIVVGGVTVNALPLIMTAINFISAAIYLKGFPIKSKLQTYGIAAIFLILLYNSPAGLVFYWTLNNLFSLVKNVFYKLENPGRVLRALASTVGIALIAYVLIAHPFETLKKDLFVIGCALLLQLPLVANKLGGRLPKLPIPEATKSDDRTFLIGCVFFAILIGLLIPTSVMQSSPTEFVDAASYTSPLLYVLNALAYSIGTFVIWFGVFYRLASPRGRTIFCVFIWACSGIAIVNYLFFGAGYGTMSPLLKFDTVPGFTTVEAAANIGICLAIAALLFLVWKFKRKAVRVVWACMCVAMIAMSAVNVASISSAIAPMREAIAAAQGGDSPHFTLSKNGRNVVVVMMDRGMPYFIPFIMNEKPELRDAFEGFTLYPNAVSFGPFTNTGVPALYGGYDYTPENMNARDDLTLREKQNECLRIMPVMFDEHGFDTTVFDPTYAGYSDYPDLSIYNDHPGIHKYITMDGQFMDEKTTQNLFFVDKSATLSRNFFCYGLFRIAPLIAQPTLYDHGIYNSTAGLKTEEQRVHYIDQERHGLSKAEGRNELFMESYTVLENLPAMTRISDGDDDNFLMMSNDTTHEPTILKEPDYTPDEVIDNTAFDKKHMIRRTADGRELDLRGDSENPDDSKTMHYHINMAMMLQFAKWIDYLKANDAYDNTRIIIVSDHGRNCKIDKEMFVPTPIEGGMKDFDMMAFNCLLLVKDFGGGTFKEDDTFMTNADTPALAMKDLIDNPVNPNTGHPIDMSGKDVDELHLLWPSSINIRTNHGNTFFPGRWYSVHDNIFVNENWKLLGQY